MSPLARRVTTTAATLVALLALSFSTVLPRADAALPVRGAAVDIFLHESSDRVLTDVDNAAALGSTTVRLAIHWSGLEVFGPNEYAQWYLDRIDATVARARARGLKVLLTPVFTPTWASSSGLQSTPPDDLADFGRFAAFLAKRYAPDLAGIEVWNEPNLVSFWSSDDAAGTYVGLVRAAHAAMKASAPSVPVVAGVLSGADTSFLEQLYAKGIQGHYDVLSVHVYNDGRHPETLIDPQYAAATFLQGLQSLRETVDRHGETKPIWITELGWNTSTLRGSLWLDGVTLEQQAEYLGRALAMLESPDWGIDFVSGVLVYRLRDTGPDADDPQQNYGLRFYDGTEKMSFGVVRSAFKARGRPKR